MKITKIEIYGRDWWRRGYGGHYQTADVYINDILVYKLPENGGTNDHFITRVCSWLKEKYNIDVKSNKMLREYCQENEIEYFHTLSEVSRHKDL